MKNELGRIYNRKTQAKRNDLAGEYPLNDLIQVILLIVFLIVWIADSFFLKLTTFAAQFFPLYLRIIAGLLLLTCWGYLTKTALKIVFVEERPTPIVIRKGPFAYVRHPIYLASVLLYLGLTIFTFSLISFLIVMAAAFYYNYAADYEEKLLIKNFGREYESYLAGVPRWFPKISRESFSLIETIARFLITLILKIIAPLSPKAAVIIRQLIIFRRIPDLRHPKTFNEKLLHKMLYDRNPLLTLIADKYRARDFIAQRLGGSQHLVRLYAVVDDPAKISGLALPSKFVMKPNHLSGKIMLVADYQKLAKPTLEKIAARWLRQNHYYPWCEWAYKNIRPLIIFEEMLEDGGRIPDDHKFYCFGGEPKFFEIDKNRFGKERLNVYDLDFSLLPIRMTYDNFPEKVPQPKNFELMLEIVRKLSAGFDFLRVDLYNLDGRIYCGELTNYPEAGGIRFKPPEWDLKIGGYWPGPR